MVRRGLADDRAEASILISQGRVTVGGAPAANSTRLVDPGEAVVVSDPPSRFVSRGGLKLDAALDRFGVDVSGRLVADIGSSTGGFTDCVLQRGAKSVLAVDVGRNQLHERLRADPRVDSRERTDVRRLDTDTIGGPYEVLVADLSFISLRSVANALLGIVAPAGTMVLLVKPQFEAERSDVDRGRGVIRDPEVWAHTLSSVCSSLEGSGAAIMGVMVSPITGGEGNVEFLIHVSPSHEAQTDSRAMCLAAIDEVGGA